ncbi:MAG: hypothetical protein ACN6O3_20985 [Comamonas sp.]
MKMIFRSILGLILAFGLFSGEAWAFKLNPCMRVLTITDGSPSQEPVWKGNPCAIADAQLQLAVHEHMTLATIHTYGAPVHWSRNKFDPTGRLAYNYSSAHPWSMRDGVWHHTLALMQGTWWNDDPLMYLWGSGLDFTKGAYKFKQVFDIGERSHYQGDVENCDVRREQHLPRWSHFGSLQHLHFMSTLDQNHTAKERVEQTTANAMVWMEFAYKVAIGEIRPTDPLTPEDEARLRLPSIAKNLCLSNPANVKVRSLLARVGPSDAASLAYRNQITPDVALGTMLHILQDSFSPAHTCRVRQDADGMVKAVLYDAYNYNEQNHKEHGQKDKFPSWFKPLITQGTHVYGNSPVVVGAWLIGAVDQKLDWQVVYSHLMETAFSVGRDTKIPMSMCLQ